MPAEAKLFLNGALAAGTGANRAMKTVPLAAGYQYAYQVKVEVVVNGVSLTEEKQIFLNAGAEVRESFPKLLAAVGRKADSAVAAK